MQLVAEDIAQRVLTFGKRNLFLGSREGEDVPITGSDRDRGHCEHRDGDADEHSASHSPPPVTLAAGDHI
jgi:hypothetical protein